MSKVNLKESNVHVREIRLGSITGLEGTAGELVRCSRSGKLKDSARSFSQCNGL
jgi:nitrogenase molybdenum-iron protein alpha chain